MNIATSEELLQALDDINTKIMTLEKEGAFTEAKVKWAEFRRIVDMYTVYNHSRQTELLQKIADGVEAIGPA
jgi:hypothetical protein